MSQADITAKWAYLRAKIDERNAQRLRDARVTHRVMAGMFHPLFQIQPRQNRRGRPATSEM